VVVAHPDDAELAIGGAIADWCSHGHIVTVACCSVSESTPALVARRREAAMEAAGILGHLLHWVVPGDILQVEDVPEYRLVGLVDALVRDLSPDVVVSHWDGDSHGDHRRVACAVVASARTWPEAALLQFGPNEHRAPTCGHFSPTLLIPMADHSDQKAQAIAAYGYADQGYRPLDEAGVSLRNRALGSQADVDAAEGLILLRAVAGTRGAAGLAALLTDDRKKT
jgi:LmbE family N-acetylglucosaminyl deacetylase